MANKRKIGADEVISQLKDDGDFDKIRVKIIRTVKENEELRYNIISAVKQSAALNRPGAEKLKPRQLSDAVFDEIGSTVMTQISDALWGVIRSRGGLEDEIRETVKSVYNRLMNPKGKEVDESSSPIGPRSRGNEVVTLPISANETENNLSEIEPEGPPGFNMCNPQSNNGEAENKEAQPVVSQLAVDGVKVKEEPNQENDAPQFNNGPSVPPGFGLSADSKEPSYISDDDPEFPPGFG
ncbi:hypothetical protein MKW98_003836 [Papaver atlanticum]|uniref:Uncharacterized protein n=1 Tax=Papaver atlanticum TaxID=357466 RepID=A0AAD4TA39_9MAGN|nr:hypothetical protein MKW98_003836 [Papaver atlanticum]